MLSAIIITKNEEDMIYECLKSLTFVDETIVVDTGNTDLTNQIAKKLGAQIISSHGADYSQFRESAISETSGDWLLYVDADERISPPLSDEILKEINSSNGFSAYAIPRHNYYLGKQMHYGGWGGDCVIRLFRKDQLIGWRGALHEQPRFSGQLSKLKSPLIHYSHRDLASMVNKTLNFTSYEAKTRLDSKHPNISWWRIFRVMFTEFWLRFVNLSAWRDGSEGTIDGMFQVFNTFIIYARLWEMQQHESSHL
jgi:glycosyltransferase involved in cell wall biosynthesis